METLKNRTDRHASKVYDQSKTEYENFTDQSVYENFTVEAQHGTTQ